MKLLGENRRARFDYEILETYEAGIELLGQEVKSVKNGLLNLAGSYAVIRGGQLWLTNADIPAYQPKNAPADYDSKRSRRLLLHGTEIKNLAGKLHEKGLNLLPIEAHLKNGFIKITLGLGKSRKKSDKRELLKKRAHEREIKREI
ncbi:MAG: SsrA-binding protein SmpB [Candidatus Liptonbacteria bacterium]|nr:SsrA-binding protein SmpB [Candidatus Liptonbacteria bacterium]